MAMNLDDLAASHGIQTVYTSELGERVAIDDEAKRRLVSALGVDPESGEGGRFEEAQETPTRQCALPEPVAGRRHWGIACQLYSLRSARSLGIGDFGDLSDLAKIAAREGASFLGVNPLHALFSADPGRYSPYSPSTRRFLNPLYVAVDRLEGGDEVVDALRAERPDLFRGLDGDLVDYPAVGRLKLMLLERLFLARRGEIDDAQAFERFREEGGENLRMFALFEAIGEAEVARGGHAGWHAWDQDLQDRRSEAVARFAQTNADRVRFHEWLQFVAEEQLAEAQAEAKSAGMAIGLYLDLAVGVAPDGAETWMSPELTVAAARVGSPPDMFNSQGQDWGLAPLSPKELDAQDYKPLRQAFEALTRNAGAVRIDHAMGLARLWWIPADVPSLKGGYVQYPLGAMIDTVAAASEANACLVIGEDLGTVPEGFRETMEAARILSYRVLYFERRDEAFLPPSAYPRLALACVSTHDLATLAGWWDARDVELRLEMGTQDAAAAERDRQARATDRRALIDALEGEGLVPRSPGAPGEAEVPEVMSDDLAAAIHRYGARTPSLLFAVQLDDLVGEMRQANLPGTTDQYPNWRIRSAVALSELADRPRFRVLVEAMRQERPA